MLFTVLLIVGVLVSALIYSLVGGAQVQIVSDKKTAAALAMAKEALIGRAAADGNRPGSLPCPDFDDGTINPLNVANDGVADRFVGNACPSYIGRLPWKTLGLADPRDGSDERLWYALSPNFRDDPAAQPINSDSVGQLTVTGTTAANNVIAIVFAPGAPIGTQLRDAANQNNVTNYLEGENANGDSIYTTGLATTSFNDRLLLITSDALFPSVQFRVAREVRAFLEAYFTAFGYYPFANDYADPDPTFPCTPLLTRGRIPNPIAPFNVLSKVCGLDDWSVRPPAWFGANNWHLVTHYAIAPACTSPLSLGTCANLGGFLTVNGVPAPNDDKRAIVIVTGRVLSGQARPCASVADCLDDAENTNGDNVFLKPVLSPTNNDRLVVVSP